MKSWRSIISSIATGCAAAFSALNEDEKDLICDHIVKNDMPDPVSVLQAQAEAAGLKVAPL